MSVLLVTYDLNRPGKDYPDLLKGIKKYPWAMLSESSYAISTSNSPEAVFKELRAFIDENDTIYVITLRRPYSGFGPQKVDEWLEKFLPQ